MKISGVVVYWCKSIRIAVWDGVNQERHGFEAVTLEWWQLRF